MTKMSFAHAIEDVIANQMMADDSIIYFGEDAHTMRRNLYVQFGADRVRSTPISESAFIGAAVTAAMSGLRPIVDALLVDFLGVAMDAILNHAAKVEAFSGGKWQVPLLIRASCSGGYGDGGQHEQSLWGWFAHIPGLTVVVPATPADAGGLMVSALKHDGPVIFLEHKLLADDWLDFVGAGGRKTVTYDVPKEGRYGKVPSSWKGIPFGQAEVKCEGDDISIVSVGVAMHRTLEAAGVLLKEGISAEVIDLRSVQPLDAQALCASVQKTGRLLVVDEDYQAFGLSGEVAAVVLEQGIPFQYARVCTQGTIPYDRVREDQALPNVPRILAAARRLCSSVS